jgi:hypothetical protein
MAPGTRRADEAVRGQAWVRRRLPLRGGGNRVGGLGPQILLGLVGLDLAVHEESARGDQSDQEQLLHGDPLPGVSHQAFICGECRANEDNSIRGIGAQDPVRAIGVKKARAGFQFSAAAGRYGAFRRWRLGNRRHARKSGRCWFRAGGARQWTAADGSTDLQDTAATTICALPRRCECLGVSCTIHVSDTGLVYQRGRGLSSFKPKATMSTAWLVLSGGSLTVPRSTRLT